MIVGTVYCDAVVGYFDFVYSDTAGDFYFLYLHVVYFQLHIVPDIEVDMVNNGVSEYDIDMEESDRNENDSHLMECYTGESGIHMQ